MPRTPLCDLLGIEVPVATHQAGRQHETLLTAGQTAGGINQILPVPRSCAALLPRLKRR